MATSDTEKSTPEKKKRPKKAKQPKRFYQLKLFWFIVAIAFITLFTGIANWVLNSRTNQERLASIIYKTSQTRLEFDDIHFNLFFGNVSGSNLTIDVEKSFISLSLKEFELRYNPLYLWILRFKITRIKAKEFLLDTRHLLVSKEKKNKVKIPDFLKRVKLKEASLEKFVWHKPGDQLITIGKVALTSRFGSTFYTSPLNLKIDDVKFESPKLHAFVDAVDLDGFFLFDFSAPRMFDESKMSATAQIDRILIAPYRTPKPWLTDRGWDIDLDPILSKYYTDGIPTDRTYVYIKNSFLDFHKTKESILLNGLKVNFFDSFITAHGQWSSGSKNFKLKVKSESGMPLSKLPLGQSKFRQSFKNFAIDLAVKGKLTNIEEHNLNVNLTTKLIGNIANPDAGDITANLNGIIKNTILNTSNLDVLINGGKVEANSTLNLKNLTTKTSVKGINVDAMTVVRLFSSVNIPSYVDANGTISGKLKNPTIKLNLDTKNATYEFLNFGQAKGSMIIENQNMKLNVKSNGSDVGTSELSMDVINVFKTLHQKMSLTSKFDNLNIKKLLDSKSLDGDIGGHFDLKRVSGKVNANGKFKALNFTYFERDIGDIDFSTHLKLKHLEVRPITIHVKNPKRTIENSKGLSFDFNDLGYKFSGLITPDLTVSGKFLKSKKERIDLQFITNKMNLDVFTSLIPFTFTESSLTSKINLDFHIYDPFLSSMTSTISHLDITTPDGKFLLNKRGGVDYKGKAFHFRNFDLSEGNGQLTLSGALGLENNSNLHIKGNVDFTPLTDFNPYISESLTPVDVNVTLKDFIFKPRVFGKINLTNNTISFRLIDVELESLNGLVKFDGRKIITDNLTLVYDDAPVTLDGYVYTDYEKVTGGNLKIKGDEVPLHFYEGLSLLSDMDLTLTGQNNMVLAGDLNIVEGLYSRNFSVTNFIISPAESLLDEEDETLAGLPLNTKYKIRIKNTGDLTIKNNITELELNADLNLAGTIEKPSMQGQLDFLGGEVNAFGLNFDDARGYAQFSFKNKMIPEIVLNAKKEIQNYNITARIDGQANNLRLRLSSVPALDHREILSVIFYGGTPDQLDDENRRNLTQTAAISQLASILANPLNKISGLDVLQVTSRRERTYDTIQRLKIGKRISKRFNLGFTTDLGTNDPERAFEMRYQLLDSFYLIAAKDIIGENRYRFDINYRIEAY